MKIFLQSVDRRALHAAALAIANIEDDKSTALGFPISSVTCGSVTKCRTVIWILEPSESLIEKMQKLNITTNVEITIK